jgi:hypothetical protein
MSWMLISIFAGHVHYHSHYKSMKECVKHIPDVNTSVVNILFVEPNYLCRPSKYEAKLSKKKI